MRFAPRAVIIIAACTPAAITPPARTFAMESPLLPKVGSSDVQVDLATAGTVFGPTVDSGAGQARTTIDSNTALEAGGEIFRVENTGRFSGTDRDAYLGRVGMVISTDDRR